MPSGDGFGLLPVRVHPRERAVAQCRLDHTFARESCLVALRTQAQPVRVCDVRHAVIVDSENGEILFSVANSE
jgi:hypothetical protein